METLIAKDHPPFYNSEVRHYNDAATWFAEVIAGQMRSQFEYTYDGNELYASDGGSMGLVFKEALQEANHLPLELNFEQRRRRIEFDEYEEMIKMMNGELPNTMVVVSDFPEELIYSHQDIGGYNVSRRQTMLRVITKNNDTLTVQSQTLDLSDRDGLEAIYDSLGFACQAGELLGQRMHLQLDEIDQELLTDQLTFTYDQKLADKFGGKWYAGRQDKRINTYDFVSQQNDLLEIYLDAQAVGRADSNLLYSLAATMQKRYQHNIINNKNLSIGLSPDYSYLANEITQATNEALSKGQTFSGCGMSISVGLGSGEELSELGYGNKSQEDKYGSLSFKCQKGHTNKRPRGRLIEKCVTCGISVKC